MMRRVRALVVVLLIGLSRPALAQQSPLPAATPTVSAPAAAPDSSKTPQTPLRDVPYLPWNVQNWLQAFGWMVAAFAAIWGIFAGVNQRRHELKWKRTEAAKTLNDEMMADAKACDAMLMIDYPSGRPFDVPGVGTTRIDRARVKHALTFSFAEHEVPVVDRFIRDAFDSLLYRVGALEHYVSRDLVEFPDVQHPVDYYINRMDSAGHREAIQQYISKYRFYRTKDFLTKHFAWEFPDWTRFESATERIAVRNSRIHGRGVFAVRRIEADEVILDWSVCSDVLSDGAVTALPPEERIFVSVIDGRNVLFKPPARFVNHSCDPNARSGDGRDIAVRVIDAGEEITVDYVVEQVPGLRLECKCDAPNCRGLLVVPPRPASSNV